MVDDHLVFEFLAGPVSLCSGPDRSKHKFFLGPLVSGWWVFLREGALV